MELGFLFLAGALLASKVYSPQYSLWLLPWFALIGVGPWLFAAFEAAEVTVFLTRFSWFGRLFHDIGRAGFANYHGFPIGAFEVTVLVRDALLLLIDLEVGHARGAQPGTPAVHAAARTTAAHRGSTDVSGASTPDTGHQRWPGLDGLRGLAILLVLFTHLGAQPGPHLFWQFTQGGIVGVDVFFVLSGFLITSLLVSEWDRRGSIHLPRFYMRRALRLLPALLVLIGLLAIASLTVVPEVWRQPTLSGVPYALFYASDLRWLMAGTVPAHPGLLDPMWSLSVEERFYLVWPTLFVLTLAFVPGARRGRAMQLALAGAVLIEAHRALMFAQGGYLGAAVRVAGHTRTGC